MKLEEELIQCVRSYPFLYDPREKEYRNKYARSQAWSEVGNKLGMSGDACKGIWIKLRNAYTNAMKRRRSKSGQFAKHMFEWKYERQMEFIQHTLEQIQTSSDEETLLDVSGETNNHTSMPQPIVCIDPPKNSFQPSSSHLSFPRNRIVQTRTTKRPLNRKPLESTIRELLSIIKENSRKRAQNLSSIDNEMDLYFLSLSKTVQRLVPEEQAKVKMQIASIVFEAEIRELQRRQEISSLKQSHIS